MKIEFDGITETRMPEFKGGEGVFIVKMHMDKLTKIMKGRLEPGSSIGMHKHETNSEIIYILSGTGRMIFDDWEEELNPGDCHYCPKGHSHSLINSGSEDLVFFAVVPEQ